MHHQAERCAEVGLPTTSFAGLVGEAITVLGAEHEADLEGGGDIFVPLFGFLDTEEAGSGDTFLGNDRKKSQYNYKHDNQKQIYINTVHFKP